MAMTDPHDSRELDPLVPQRQEPAHTPASGQVRATFTRSLDDTYQTRRSARTWAKLGAIGVAAGLVSAGALYGYGVRVVGGGMKLQQQQKDSVAQIREGVTSETAPGIIDGEAMPNTLIVYIDDQGYNGS